MLHHLIELGVGPAFAALLPKKCLVRAVGGEGCTGCVIGNEKQFLKERWDNSGPTSCGWQRDVRSIQIY